MLVRVPDDRSFAVGFLNLRFTGALVHAQNVVIVLALALFNLKLARAQFFAQTLRLGCDLLQLVVLVHGFLPELLIHLDITFFHVSFGIL